MEREDKNLFKLKDMVVDFLKNEKVTILVFGSRARKEYLKEKEGILCNSPKSCFREIFSLGFLTEDAAAAFLEMTDRRNETSHTYKEEVADIIYHKVSII